MTTNNANIIDGKEFSKKVRAGVKVQCDALKEDHNLTPGLAVVLVGEDPASSVYVRNKVKGCLETGIYSEKHDLSIDTEMEELLSLINKLNNDDKIHGILVQLPLPDHLEEKVILQAIDPSKDVDGFHPYNTGLLLEGSAVLKPCTPFGIMEMFKEYNVNLSGKDAVIVGRSNIVGKPMAIMMIEESATVTVCHSRTRDLPAKVKAADIVVAAVGRPEFVKGEWIKEGAVVIDVGINRLDTGKLVGDVEFAEAAKRASLITPVPGGVGPMTIAMLLQNTVNACKKINNL